MRRSHRKSRNGCKECKKRHRKCDESRPTCANCSTAEIQCSYLSTPRSSPVVLRPLTSATAASSEQPSPGPASHSPAPTNASPSTLHLFSHNGDPTQVFTLQHLGLLHHFESDLLRSLDVDDAQTAHFSQTVVPCALQAPYLMDQILALAAAHLSTLYPNQRAMYRHEATHLQTRGLALFNASQAQEAADNSEQAVLAKFMYSSFLGLHVMFDTLLCHDDLNELLNRLTAYMSVHRGVRAVTGQSWPLIAKALQPLIGDLHLDTPPSTTSSGGHECDVLMALIDQADFGEASATTCREAVKSLQWAFDGYRRMPTKGSRGNVVVAWPIIIPAGFVDMLRLRKPEALVIVAYYAVLLHRSRDFWVFGDGGRFLLRAISTCLGPYWAEWLSWPNEMMEVGD